MHRTGVDTRVHPALRAYLVHLGHEGECFVRWSLDERLDPFAQRAHVLVRAQAFELLREIGLSRLFNDVDGG
jgi:hypothetical protein